MRATKEGLKWREPRRIPNVMKAIRRLWTYWRETVAFAREAHETVIWMLSSILVIVGLALKIFGADAPGVSVDDFSLGLGCIIAVIGFLWLPVRRHEELQKRMLPVLGIDSVEIVFPDTGKWQIDLRIQNLSPDKTADDVRLRVVSFDTALKGYSDIIIPRWVDVKPVESDSINAGGTGEFRLGSFSYWGKGQPTLKIISSPNDLYFYLDDTKTYFIKLLATARDFPPCEVEFEISCLTAPSGAGIFMKAKPKVEESKK